MLRRRKTKGRKEQKEKNNITFDLQLTQSEL
jgi:hypothetical protein